MTWDISSSNQPQHLKLFLSPPPPHSPPTAALSSLQHPLSLYLLTHLPCGEVVAPHGGIMPSSNSVVSLYYIVSFLYSLLFSLVHLYFFLYPALSFTAWYLFSGICHSSVWCVLKALWPNMSADSLTVLTGCCGGTFDSWLISHSNSYMSKTNTVRSYPQLRGPHPFKSVKLTPGKHCITKWNQPVVQGMHCVWKQHPVLEHFGVGCWLINNLLLSQASLWLTALDLTCPVP